MSEIKVVSDSLEKDIHLAYADEAISLAAQLAIKFHDCFKVIFDQKGKSIIFAIINGHEIRSNQIRPKEEESAHGVPDRE